MALGVVTSNANAEPWRRRLYLPAYAVSEAARYARTAPQTIAYWLYGDGERLPIVRGKERRKPLSYLQLVEIAFVASFRRAGVPLSAIRRAHDYVAQTLETEYPFATIQFQTEGNHIFFRLQEIEPVAALDHLIVADRDGQVGWEALISDRFMEFDYEGGLALRWHVAGRESPVLIDPRIAFGAPTVQGVATWALRGRIEAGETISEIVQDFGLDERSVRGALNFEGIEQAA
jgi:uncharacterized protein (DUF433 family)